MKKGPRKLPTVFYKKVLENFAIPCVDVVVVCGHEFLLVKRKNEPAKGEWWVPGGRVFKGEKIYEAAKRKVWEEVGLKVLSLKQLFAEDTMFETSAFGVSTHTVGIIYSARVKSRKAVLDRDHSEYKWFSKIDGRWDPYVKKALRCARFK